MRVSEGGLEPPRPLRTLAPQASASAIPPLGPAEERLYRRQGGFFRGVCLPGERHLARSSGSAAGAAWGTFSLVSAESADWLLSVTVWGRGPRRSWARKIVQVACRSPGAGTAP